MITTPELATSEVPTKQKKNTLSSLLWQGSGAVVWGVFFSVLSLPGLMFPGMLIWIPLWIWREHVRSKRYGFVPGFLVRVLVFSTIVSAAVMLPDRYEDKVTIGPLSSTQVSLEELAGKLQYHRVMMKPNEAQSKIVVQLSSQTPTLREVITAVEQASRLKFVRYDCGTGASLLSGTHPIRMKFE